MIALYRFTQLLALLVVMFLLSACGGGGGSSDQTTTFTIEGGVLNGPLDGSTVQVFGANGGSALGTATTDGDGRYAAQVSRGGPYRLRASGGKLNGVDYTGVLEAACAGGSNCFVTPYTTVILRLVDDHGFNTGDAAGHLANRLGFDADPFAGRGLVEGFDLDAARHAIAGGDDLAAWVASVVAWATSEGAEPPPGIGSSGPVGPPGPPGEPDPVPPPGPDPEPEPVPDPDPGPIDPVTHAVSATAGTGGDIGPPSQTVDHGATATFMVTPETGYSVDTVGGCDGRLDGNTYTTGAITEACTVTASFALNTYTVSATAGTGGNISPDSRTVNYGDTTSFMVFPDAGYSTESVGGCGGVFDIFTSTYFTSPITDSCAVSAEFSRDPQPFLLVPPVQHSLTYAGPAEGNLSYSIGYREHTGSEVVADQTIWIQCNGDEIFGDAYWAPSEYGVDLECRILDSGGSTQWSVSDLNIGSSFEFNGNDAWSGSAEYQKIEDGDSGFIREYGQLSIATEIDRVPATEKDSQGSLIYLLRASWISEPRYIIIDVQPVDVPRQETARWTTRVQIGAQEIDHPHRVGEVNPDLIIAVDEVVEGAGRIEFAPAADSEFHSLVEPIGFSLRVEQQVTVTRIPD